MGSVAVSDSIVAITCSYLRTDGMSLMNAVDKCLRPNIEPPPLFPRSFENVFADKMKNSDISIMKRNLQKISRHPKGSKPLIYDPQSVRCKLVRNHINFRYAMTKSVVHLKE